jgi:outer membrane lipoprotein-sorting protein
MCAALFGMVVMNRMAASTSTSTFALHPAQGDAPVERTRKNIQVLKGLPESQLFPLMNFVATSLGVHCDYCHVKNPGKNPQTGGDNWVWESDDKPKKLVGRRMMKMVLDINGTNFNGDTFVTCYTCHRGNTIIARLPPLPPHDPIPRETALPTAEQILAKYVAAVGGKDAAAKFKTTVMKGTVERSEGRNAQLEVTLKDTDKYLITQTSPQGVSTLGVNGDVGWVKNSALSRRLSGRSLDQSRRAAAYYAIIKVVEQPAQMKVLGTEKIGDREAYVVTFVVDPDTTIRLFFDTQTGLLLRELTTQRTMLVPLPEQVDFEDYKDVDGVKLPFTIRTSNTATYDTATHRFTEIRHNVAVNDDIFNLTAAPR